MAGEVILRFEKVTFEFGPKKPILQEVDFTVRRGSKITIMGQNGAGKSTIFKLITGELQPEEGNIHLQQDLSIAISRQVIPRDQLDLNVMEFFAKSFDKKVYDLEPRIKKILQVVNLPHADFTKKIRAFSGGQQARLLLATALIQDPDLLLLDEPTNNLDKAGIQHLTDYLIEYKKSVMVISHDAEFLNAFSHGVLYLDAHTQLVEQHVGNYHDVVKNISARIEKENRKNALLQKEIQAKKDQANAFANKGGQMRLVAKRMREKALELEEEIVDVRKEDKPIRPFTIPCQPDLIGEIIKVSSFTTMVAGKVHKRKKDVKLRRNNHLLLAGPNGIGKSTLLESIANGTAEGAEITAGVKVGYYRQDFSTLNFEDTVYEALCSVVDRPYEETIRALASGFHLTGQMMHTKIGSLSEGQKGLVAFAQLVLLQPGLLILDEPTNHINFRHLPVIAKALDKYEGAMILVSHVPEFVKQVRVDEVLDLEK